MGGADGGELWRRYRRRWGATWGEMEVEAATRRGMEGGDWKRDGGLLLDPPAWLPAMGSPGSKTAAGEGDGDGRWRRYRDLGFGRFREIWLHFRFLLGRAECSCEMGWA